MFGLGITRILPLDHRTHAMKHHQSLSILLKNLGTMKYSRAKIIQR